jgi:hypothetical protein
MPVSDSREGLNLRLLPGIPRRTSLFVARDGPDSGVPGPSLLLIEMPASPETLRLGPVLVLPPEQPSEWAAFPLMSSARAFSGKPVRRIAVIRLSSGPGRRRHVDHVQADLPVALEQIAARYNEGAGAVRRSSVTP